MLFLQYNHTAGLEQATESNKKKYGKEMKRRKYAGDAAEKRQSVNECRSDNKCIRSGALILEHEGEKIGRNAPTKYRKPKRKAQRQKDL